MKTFPIRFLLVCICINCLACKKENAGPPPTPAIYGNWKFLSLRSENQRNESTSAGVNTYETVYNESYTATDISGSIEVTPSYVTQKMIKSTMLDSNVIVNYANGVPQDTATSNNFNVLPQMDSKLSYSLVGQDSLIFVAQNVFGSFVPNYPSTLGAKYFINGDILTITSKSYGNAGSTSNTIELKSSVMTFQRQ